MKIEYEIQDVKVIRRRTIAEALALHPDVYHLDMFSGLLSGDFLVKNPSSPEALYKPLLQEHEGEEVYWRTCALATLGEEWRVSEFYQALRGKGYYPAGMSESSAYLSALKERGVEVSTIIHLGTCIIDDTCREQRLLTRGNTKVELVPWYTATKLKSYYHVVVVKEEEKLEKK